MAVLQSQLFCLTVCEPSPAETLISQLVLVSQFLGVLSLRRNRHDSLFQQPNESPVFFSSQHRQRSLQVPLRGIYSSSRLFMEKTSGTGKWRHFASQTAYSGYDGCHVSSGGFGLWQSLFISAHIATAHCAVMQQTCCFIQNWFINLSVMEFFCCVLCFVLGLAHFPPWPQVLVQNEMLSPNIMKCL